MIDQGSSVLAGTARHITGEDILWHFEIQGAGVLRSDFWEIS